MLSFPRLSLISNEKYERIRKEEKFQLLLVKCNFSYHKSSTCQTKAIKPTCEFRSKLQLISLQLGKNCLNRWSLHSAWGQQTGCCWTMTTCHSFVLPLSLIYSTLLFWKIKKTKVTMKLPMWSLLKMYRKCEWTKPLHLLSIPDYCHITRRLYVKLSIFEQFCLLFNPSWCIHLFHMLVTVINLKNLIITEIIKEIYLENFTI